MNSRADSEENDQVEVKIDRGVSRCDHRTCTLEGGNSDLLVKTQGFLDLGALSRFRRRMLTLRENNLIQAGYSRGLDVGAQSYRKLQNAGMKYASCMIFLRW